MGTRLERESFIKTVWPSGLRRWLKAPFRKGVGSSPAAVTCRWTIVWSRYQAGYLVAIWRVPLNMVP